MKTWKDTNNKEIDAVIRKAESQAGVSEQRLNNYGPEVRIFLKQVGLSEKNPWCAAFVSWCLHQAGILFPHGNDLNTGDTWEIEGWARRNGVYSQIPGPGTIFLLIGADDKPFHTGFVESVNDDDSWSTIEGNTKAEGVTTGFDGVHRRTRTDRAKFVMWFVVGRLRG